jgi:hypothetical protein
VMGAAELAGRIADMHLGRMNGRGLVAEFRRALVLVPLREGGLWSVDSEGVRWLLTFTGEEALSRFAASRGIDAGAEVPYMSVYGARLLEVAVPAMGVPAGVAVDVAGPWPALLPPVMGIVPEVVAVAA